MALWPCLKSTVNLGLASNLQSTSSLAKSSMKLSILNTTLVVSPLLVDKVVVPLLLVVPSLQELVLQRCWILEVLESVCHPNAAGVLVQCRSTTVTTVTRTRSESLGILDGQWS